MNGVIFSDMHPSMVWKNCCLKRPFCLLMALALPLSVLHAQPSAEAIWQLGWRMLLHAEQEQWALADREFDTLYQWSLELMLCRFLQSTGNTCYESIKINTFCK
jgi:hypothetical protein